VSRLILDGEEVLVEMGWKFLSETEADNCSRKRGGIFIKRSASRQFGEGDGENGIPSLAAWVVGQVPNGIIFMPVDHKRCWLCGTIAGFVAPGTDVLMVNEDLPAALEMLEDIVPDDRYLLHVGAVAIPEKEPMLFDALLAGLIFEGAQKLELQGLQEGAKVVGMRTGNTEYKKSLLGAVLTASLLVVGYFGYERWQQGKQSQQQEHLAEESRLQQLLAMREQEKQANSYRAAHQAANMFEVARITLASVQMESKGWQLQKIQINDRVNLEYKRGSGTLAPFIEENKQNISWSQDGGTATLDWPLTDIPVPLHAYELEAMNEVDAITLMQRIAMSDMQAGLLTVAPVWASTVPAYPLMSRVSQIYWKVGTTFGRMQSALSLLQHPNVSVGHLAFDFTGKRCEIEGLIYAQNNG